MAALLPVFASAQLPPAADSFVNSGAPGANYGDKVTLDIQSARESLITFSFAALPAGVSVAKATLRLYVSSVNAAGSFNVYPLLSSWAESAVTYSSLPGVGALAAGPVAISSANAADFVLVDVTSLVGSWLSGGLANNGVALVLVGSTGKFSFESKENAHPPELDVVLNGPAGPIGPQGPVGATGPQGPMGLTGPQGIQGIQGFKGDKGDTGVKGDKGDKGDTGTTGQKGDKGDTGETGPAGPGLKLVDRDGQAVGTLVDPSLAAVFVDGYGFLMSVDANGFVSLGAFMYATTDCSDEPRVVERSSKSLWIDNYVLTADGTLRYVPPGTGQLETVQAIQVVNQDGSLSSCQMYGPVSYVVGEFVTATLQVFVPPFRVSQ